MTVLGCQNDVSNELTGAADPAYTSAPVSSETNGGTGLGAAADPQLVVPVTSNTGASSSDGNAPATASPNVAESGNGNTGASPAATLTHKVVVPPKPSTQLTGIPASARSSATSVRADPNFYNASFLFDANNPVVRLHTTLWVPDKPPARGLLFLWPGLQPTADGGGGVLQPVLVWGANACISAATQPPAAYSSWWIAGYYVDSACHVGRAMSVNPGDPLDIDMAQNGNVWTMTMVNASNGNQVTYAYDLEGRRQNWAIFSAETQTQYPTEPILFGGTTLTFARPRSGGCTLNDIGRNNGITEVVLSEDRRTCSFAGLALRNATPR